MVVRISTAMRTARSDVFATATGYLNSHADTIAHETLKRTLKFVDQRAQGDMIVI